jgi:hypothetical protein
MLLRVLTLRLLTRLSPTIQSVDFCEMMSR